MKKISLPLIVLQLLLWNVANAQGKFAGTHQSLIGKSFTDEKHIPALKGYTFIEGTLLTAIDEPKQVLCDLYKKGSACVFIVTALTDTLSKIYTIKDVLEIAHLPAQYQLKSATCRVNEKEDMLIVALVKDAKSAYLKNVKQAWRIDISTQQIMAADTRGIDCINEGFGE